MTNGAPEPPPKPPAAAWQLVVQIAGAIAGLTVLVYFAGSATMWLRLKKAGYAADLAVEHQSRSELLAIGLRGLAAVIGVFVLLTVVTLLLVGGSKLEERLLRNRPRSQQAVAWLKERYLDAVQRLLILVVVVAGPVRLLDLDRKVVGYVLVGAAVLALAGTLVTDDSRGWLQLSSVAVAVLGASLISFRVFGIVVAIAAMLGLFLLGGAASDQHPLRSLASIGVLAAAALVATVSWQIDGTVRVQGVHLTPVPKFMLDQSKTPELLDSVAFPYFGETSEFVYVADVRAAERDRETGRIEFTVCCSEGNQRIVEVKRSEVRLSFPAEKDVLYSTLAPPAFVFWNFVKTLD